ncbi:hypothetical protein L226DRAFT_506562 [Lentinus tigrinus ALCF2SS1-7]|uniref:MYND-type domain-containing protein n=1 Tax=Lentinus tigrinus ALCF2SS1-6 TaxID=1328759 RepID=A0A5C2SH25_9APHY|nr:hypothetical protein L227DRAFT_547627 [Lentinus tigrinus ALCF2SS1-6]RPD75883.1 hypothetical protein L226DRAFT_506562 [Lentinus tigrinus ALCF2SS1-7]
MERITRPETLEILSCMGIELPRTTRLPDDVLDKRLRDALNYSQHKSGLPPSLDPERLPRWPQGRPLFKMLRKVDLAEVREIENAERAGGVYERELFQDVFWDLGQTMMAIGKALDSGRTWCVVQDSEQTLAVLLRFLCVVCVDSDTPGVVLTYWAINNETGAEGADWICMQMRRDVGVTEIKATVLEMKLLLKVLAMNARLLPPEYKPPKDPLEKHFKLSVLFPLAPLSFDVLGKLNSDVGCALCGKRQASRCSQCHSVSYCGAGTSSLPCQKADWPSHKQTCRSLKGGHWVTIPFRMSFPGEPNNTILSYHSDIPTILDEFNYTLRKALGAENGPPPNIHGEKTFLVKLQAPEGAFLIYDRRKSFHSVFFWREDDPTIYDQCIAEIRGPRIVYGGRKMYRWARRTGDFQLSVCLDREPNTVIKW